ncbi:ionotropic receptor 25a-like [Saccostrea echinata]|uniref:ionotropic receptor 25a-like n=1 Tax=Saccostrea echinata TaxID=191078 RepID=UPI002A814338|nr:ionotropic receptor 25a-like [Saccostrea echinata]
MLNFVFLYLFILHQNEPVQSRDIVAVLAKEKHKNLKLLEDTLKDESQLHGWNGGVKVIKLNSTNPITALEKVCSVMADGAVLLIDMADSLTGQLLRSFARSAGLPYVTLLDRSTLIEKDFDPDLHLEVEPPGSIMMGVVRDVITHENLTRIAVLYDNSFDLDKIPKRYLSGLSAQHLFQEIISTTHNATLEQLYRLEENQIRNFFIVASKENVMKILETASSTRLMDEKYRWFVLTKDMSITCQGCKNHGRGTVILITGRPNNEIMENSYIPFIRGLSKYISTFTAEGSNVDEAFLFDLMNLIGTKLVEQNVQKSMSLNQSECYSVIGPEAEVFNQSRMFIQSFQNSSKNGVFGPLYFKNNVLKQRLTLSIKRLTFSKQAQSTELLGNWTEEMGLRLFDSSLLKPPGKKKYKIVVVPTYPPFVIAKGNNSFDGYCMDLLHEIQKILKFDYELYSSPDGLVGSMDEKGHWNGIVKELMEKRADIAIGPISVMAERENVIDFTVPYYDLVGLTILLKKPEFDYELFKFLVVLDEKVWLCIIAAYFLFSGLLYVFDKLSPYSYQNNKKNYENVTPEPRVFTIKEGIWFCMMSLTPQGGGEAPRALSGRLIAATWWLFGFIVIATYTANLAAFLTVSRLEEPIKSLDDLSSQHTVKYAPHNGSAAMVYFQRMAEIEQRFYSIWKNMSLDDTLDPVERAKLAVWDYPVSNKYTKLWETMKLSGFPNSLDEALSSVKNGTFAYIGDAAENQYQTMRSMENCDLWQVGEEFSRKPFALAVQNGSPLRNDLSTAILQLLNQRMLEKLKKKWWDKNKVKCPKLENESEGISLNNIGGVFILIAGGAALALVCLGFELYFFKYKPRQASKNYGVAKSHSKANLPADKGTKKENGVNNTWSDENLESSCERSNGSMENPSVFNRSARGVTFSLGESL